jgi:hypothetical protein
MERRDKDYLVMISKCQILRNVLSAPQHYMYSNRNEFDDINEEIF